jgi:uncharacterized protein (DUF4415 family)
MLCRAAGLRDLSADLRKLISLRLAADVVERGKATGPWSQT